MNKYHILRAKLSFMEISCDIFFDIENSVFVFTFYFVKNKKYFSLKDTLSIKFK